MLYVEINTLSDFCKFFPESRQDSYTYEGLNALFNYWSSRADDEDIEVDESLDYDCCEYNSAAHVVKDMGEYDELVRDMAENYCLDNDIDTDEVDIEDYIEMLDEDDIEAKCVEFMEDSCEIDYFEELDHGGYFVVRS